MQMFDGDSFIPQLRSQDPRRNDDYYRTPLTSRGRPYYFKAPAGGVPPFNATTGQLGSAVCQQFEPNSTGQFAATGRSYTIYNESGWIEPNSMIEADVASSGILIGQPPAEKLYQYQLRTNWYGGIAMAYVKSMDGYSFGQTVIINNPLGEASYQKAGDKGEMIFKPGINKYYWIQAPCGTTNTPPPEPPPAPGEAVGACCLMPEIEGGMTICLDGVSESSCAGYPTGVFKGNGSTCVSQYQCP